MTPTLIVFSLGFVFVEFVTFLTAAKIANKYDF